MSNIKVECVVKVSFNLAVCKHCSSDLLEQNFSSEAAIKFVRCTSCGLSTPRVQSAKEAESLWNAINNGITDMKNISNIKKHGGVRKRLTNEQKIAVIKEAKECYDYVAVARKFGIHYTTVYKLVHCTKDSLE